MWEIVKHFLVANNLPFCCIKLLFYKINMLKEHELNMIVLLNLFSIFFLKIIKKIGRLPLDSGIPYLRRR